MEHIHEKIVESGEWLIEDDVSLDSLVIKDGAEVPVQAGTYTGKIKLELK